MSAYKTPFPYRPTVDEAIAWHKAIWFSLFEDTEKTFERWDTASNVIFGAMLSAYFGYKISTINESVYNSFLISCIIFFHVIFLFSIIFSRKAEGVISLVSVEEKNYDISNMYRIIIPLICVTISGIVWHKLFSEYYFYVAIIGLWLFTSVAYALFANHIIYLAIHAEMKRENSQDKVSKVSDILVEKELK